MRGVGRLAEGAGSAMDRLAAVKSIGRGGGSWQSAGGRQFGNVNWRRGEGAGAGTAMARGGRRRWH